MWKSRIISSDTDTSKFRMEDREKLLSYAEVISLWQNSTDFTLFFIDILKQSVYEGFFLEVKPVTLNSISDAFEFVLVKSSVLPRIAADRSPFEKYFTGNFPVVSFPNHGGDAVLIVPAPIGPDADYAHLAKFVRNGTDSQLFEFWKKVAQEYKKAIGTQPKWLSTAGLGVYWLHIRIDSSPKYYRYENYKKK